MSEGPPFTVLDARTLSDGRVRVLVRKRGGRLVRLTVAAVASDGPTINDLIGHVLASWPPIPGPATTEDFDGK